MIDTLTLLAASSDPDTFGEMFMAAIKTGGDSGNSSLDNIITKVIRAAGAITGVGFLVQASFVGLKKGKSNESGKEAMLWIAWGVAIMVVFNMIPKLLGISENLFGGFL